MNANEVTPQADSNPLRRSSESAGQTWLALLARQPQDGLEVQVITDEEDFADIEDEESDRAGSSDNEVDLILNAEEASILERIRNAPLNVDELKALNAEAVGKFENMEQKLAFFAKCVEIEWQKLNDYFDASERGLEINETIRLLKEMGDHGHIVDLVTDSIQAKLLANASARSAAEVFEKFGRMHADLGCSQNDLLALAKVLLETFCLNNEKRKEFCNRFNGDIRLIQTIFVVLERNCLRDQLSIDWMIKFAGLHRSYFIQSAGLYTPPFVVEMLVQEIATNYQFVLDHETDLQMILFDESIRNAVAHAFYEYALANKNNEDILIEMGKKIGVYVSPGSSLRQEMDNLVMEYIRSIDALDAPLSDSQIQTTRFASLFKRLREDETGERRRLKTAFYDAIESIKQGAAVDGLGQFASIDGFFEIFASLYKEGSVSTARFGKKLKDMDLHTAWIAFMLAEMADARDQMPYAREDILQFCDKVNTLFDLGINWDDERDSNDYNLENSLYYLHSKA